MIEGKYKISIIVPVYNVGQYLEKTIKSVINQTIGFKNLQLILVNDGSKDNSGYLCLKYKEKYPENIVYIDKENNGVSSARNDALNVSLGKYVLFLDGDDYISLNACEKLYNFFEDNYDVIDVVTYPIMNVRKNNITKHNRYDNLYYNGTGVYDLNKDYYLIQSNVNVIVKNNKKYRFNESMKFVEDEDFVSRILLSKMKIGFVSECSYYYLKRDDNSNNTVVYDIEEMKIVYENYKKHILEQNKHPYFQNLFINALRWRIVENKLYCNEESYNIINDLTCDILKIVDINNIINFPFMSLYEMFYLFKLRNSKLSYVIEDRIKLFCDDAFVCKVDKLKIDIFRVNVINNKLYISGGISDLYYNLFKDIKLFIVSGAYKKEVKLIKNIEKKFYYKKLEYMFKICCDLNSDYEFYFEIDGMKFYTKLNYSNMRSSLKRVIVYKDKIINNNLKFRLKKNIYNNVRCLNSLHNTFDRIKYQFLREKNICINFTNTKFNKFKGCKVLNYCDIKTSDLKRLFCSCKYIIISDLNFQKICPFGNLFYAYNDLYRFESILYFTNNICYNSFENNFSDFVLVNNKSNVKKLVTLYNYNEEEIIIEKK